MSIWDKFLELQAKPPSKWVQKGYDDKSNYTQELEAQRVFSKPEYTIISETEETIFVQDENGAPHVFTREEWEQINGGMIGGGAFAVALVVCGLAWLIF